MPERAFERGLHPHLAELRDRKVEVLLRLAQLVGVVLEQVRAPMDIADLLASEPPVIASWAYRVYDRIQRQHLSEPEWRALFEFGVDASLRRRDMAGLHAMLALAANYFDSIGDQFGCLRYIEDTMQLVALDPHARAVVLDCTRDIMVGNS